MFENIFVSKGVSLSKGQIEESILSLII